MAEERGATITQLNLENINDNHPSSPEMFRAKAALNTTAWVLLFESKLTEACSTSYDELPCVSAPRKVYGSSRPFACGKLR